MGCRGLRGLALANAGGMRGVRSNRRVVLTGIGVVAPNGIGKAEFWRTLAAGESGIGRITHFDTKGYPASVAGIIKDFDLRRYVDGPSVRPHRMARHTQLGLAASALALKDAGMTSAFLRSIAPLQIVLGVSSGGVDVIGGAQELLMTKGPMGVKPHMVGACQPHAVASAVASLLQIEVRILTVSTACAAGLDAVSQACDHIRSGRADLVLTGGADSPTSALGVAAFCAAGLVPSLNGEDPRTVSRPFDRLRKGGIMAEGACILVIERLENALARGARPYLEFLGSGDSVDAPGTESGSGMSASMGEALTHSCLRASDVDYVCAHGPSDPVLDRVESQAIRAVLGSRADSVPVSSIKGVTGNPLSAAGPMELAACALMFLNGRIPPTANYTDPDPACDLDYVSEGARRARPGRVLVNVHGLGGGNSSIVVRRGPDA